MPFPLACLANHSLRFSTQVSRMPEEKSTPSTTRQKSSASSGPEGERTSGAATEALARGSCRGTRVGGGDELGVGGIEKGKAASRIGRNQIICIAASVPLAHPGGAVLGNINTDGHRRDGGVCSVDDGSMNERCGQQRRVVHAKARTCIRSQTTVPFWSYC